MTITKKHLIELKLQNQILDETNILKLVELRIQCNTKNSGVTWEDCITWIKELKKNGRFK